MQDQEQSPLEQRFFGTAVSRGIAVGRAVVLKGTDALPDAQPSIAAEEIEAEILRFRTGYERATSDLSKLAAPDTYGLFGVHLLILEDAFADGIEQRIRKDQISAEAAIRSRSRELAARQRAVADSHIREKYLDIYDVAERLIRALVDHTRPAPGNSGSIYVVSELTPSLVIALAAHHPRGIVSQHGGWTSHTSILSREYRLPAVTGVPRLEEVVVDGDLMIIDGNSGSIIVHPNGQTLAELDGTLRSNRPPDGDHGTDFRTETADGVEIVVRVNANLPEVYDRARRAGANGIGLYRSEVLFDRRDAFPNEDEQYEAYCEIAASTQKAGVRIRTFDIGVDRLPHDARYPPRNPSLGLRAARYSLSAPDQFRKQVRAILRASAGRNVDIVLPMISGVNDVLQLRRLIDEERLYLTERGIQVGHPRLGVMIETPSAVMTAADIAKCVDFFCLGTNDLVQYLLAVDRDDPAVSDWYQTLHPAVTSAIRSVIEAGTAAGIPVTVCGEMAGSPFYVPLLIGLGAREVSMNVNSVAAVRNTITDLDTAKCSFLAARIEDCVTAEESNGALRDFYKEHWPFLVAARD